MTKITLSVHSLVDFVLRTGDIDTRVFNLETMTKGTQLHTYYQAKQNKRYLAEQYLEHVFFYDKYEILLQGRVDGVIVNDDGVIIEEIKTTNSDLSIYFSNNEEWHLGQAQCYALMYAIMNNISEIGIQLTYISQVDESKILKKYTFTREKLKVAINSFFSIYFSFYNRVSEYENERAIDLEALRFPFSQIRHSQQVMINEVEESLKNKTKMYFNAPTGSGKTMAALYPSLKYMVKNPRTKIFYLTAKGSGKAQAENALKIISQTTKVKSITISAKEKMCLNGKIACNPDECPFARNYYGKIKNALFDIYANENEYSTPLLLEYAQKHEVCPFEYQLDLSLLTDVIIADYNYLFDPFVYLRRFFDKKQGEYIVLIDEAHNLPRRVMDNYSHSLNFSAFYAFRRVMKGPEHKDVRQLINRIVKVLLEYAEFINPPFETINEFPSTLLPLLEKMLIVGSDYMQSQGNNLVEGFSDFYFEVRRFIKILSIMDDNFVLYTEIDEEMKFFPKFHLKCLNPTRFITEALKGVDNTIFFSATLAPENYFKTMLDIEGDITHIPNPFNKEQLLLLIDPTVSLYYKDREASLDEVVAKIIAATSLKVGNYLVYVPSFAYLNLLELKLRQQTKFNIVSQRQQMSDYEKDLFLDEFVLSPQESKIGLAVLGGSFSEGVDLVSDRLSGVIILGVGYPPPSFEKQLEEEYFNKTNDAGMMYAYVYPALNKILQTMGRVIRSEEDKGFVLLMDKRYKFSPYREHLETYHGQLKYVSKAKHIGDELSMFFYN